MSSPRGPARPHTERDSRLCFVFAQKDRRKYSWSLPRLLEVSRRFEEWNPHVVVVDNDREGAWDHEVSSRLTHVGGDNRHWEFSAFDRGIGWAREHLVGTDLWVLATDACLAYGEEYLDLVTPAVARLATSEGACVGWIDSFGETCSLFGLEYDAWLRTSCLFLPDPVARQIEPLAQPLRSDEIFGPEVERPFRSTAPISLNLQALLRAWLTTGSPEGEALLEETWHSRFELSTETFPLFRAKVASILREHLLSATLRSRGIAAYDFRVVGSLPDAWSQEDRTWLRGLRQVMELQSRPTTGRESQRIVMVADFGAEANRLAAIHLAQEVLPLLRQRRARASLVLAGPGGTRLVEIAGLSGVRLESESRPPASWVEATAALVVAPQVDASSEGARDAAARSGVPLVHASREAVLSPATELATRLDGCFAEMPRAAV